jgi:acetyl-CoA carboxylase biotin carboxyl carrier protein
MSDEKDLTVDADLVRALAALLEETRLTEIEYAVGERRVRVVRAPHAPPAVTLAVPPSSLQPATLESESAAAIKAPMVGTIYLSPQPELPPFIKVGDHIRQGQILLIIEAMKVMNQVPAPRDGRVTAILVVDGSPVEFGQPLLMLE